MNRRSFLLFTGAFASSVIVRPRLGAVPLQVATPVIQDVPPRLWGDGIHDDSVWFQWMIDHTRGRVLDLQSGTFRLESALRIHEDTQLVLKNGIFVWRGPPDQATIVFNRSLDERLALV